MPTFGIDVCPATRRQKTGTEWYTVHLVAAMQQQLKDGEKILLYSPETLRWPFKRLWTQGRLAFEMLRRPPDVLFVPSHVVPWVHPKKTVTTIHDIGFVRRPDLYDAKSRHYLETTTKFAVKHCAKLLTPSEFTKQEVVDVYHVDPEKIIVTPLAPGQIATIDPVEINRVRAKYQLTSSTFLTVSRMESKKNIAALIRGFEIFKERRGIGDPFQLVLVGKPGFGYEKIKPLIERSPAKEAIRELGWVSEEDITALVAGAFAYVYPSWYEGLGISALEALAAGAPVIASDIPALHEAAGDAALYFNPSDPRELAREMTKLVEEGTTREALVSHGRSRALELSWDKTAAATWEVLRSL
ncbi:MAG: glycosyltransferase family 1 protein [Patescibacteria group bacterium]